MLIPHYPENIPASPLTLTIHLWSYRIQLYSPNPVLSPPVARPLAHISMVTEYLSRERVDQALTFPRPRIAVFAHISMITEHLSHERVHQALTFPGPCGQRSIPSGFLISTISSRNCWPSHRSSGRHSPKTRARRSFTSPKERFLLGELDIVAQDSALLRERDVIQDLNTGLTHVPAYKKPGLACAFPHRRLHSGVSTKQALLLKKVEGELKDITAVEEKQDFPTLADWQPYSVGGGGFNPAPAGPRRHPAQFAA